MKKTALLVDDETAALEHLQRLLSFCEDIQVVSKTNVPEEALTLITDLKPDLLFLDIEMPRISGFEILNITRNQGLDPVVIFTTAYNQYAIKAVKAQAFDYLLKPVVFDELKETLKRLDNNHQFSINNSFTSSLSPRESDVLELLIRGKSSAQIAAELFISKLTVDTHRRNILKKTGAKNTAELISRMLSY